MAAEPEKKAERRPYTVEWVIKGTTVVEGTDPENAQYEFDKLGGYRRYCEDAHEIEVIDVKPRST